MNDNQEAEKLEAMAQSLRGDFGSEYVKDAASMLEKLAAEKRKAADVQFAAQKRESVILPDSIGLEICAPISHEWLAHRSGYREGWNKCLAKVRELNTTQTQPPSPDQDREVSP